MFVSGHTFGSSLGPIIVREGDNVMLRCGATGIPPPHVEWRRISGKTIPMGAWEGNSFTECL